jgi:hypothetical protein
LFTNEVRGIYNHAFIGLIRPELTGKQISAAQFDAAIKKMVLSPFGVIPENQVESDIYEICHHRGLLFSHDVPQTFETKFIFPSPWQQRSA